MHDVIPRLTRAERENSIGWFVVWWIETFCVVGSGAAMITPMVFSPEYAAFVVDCYALDKHGKRRFDNVFLSRPKGSNKSGLAALICLAESLAPVRFDHYAEAGETYTFLGQTYHYREGEPVGRLVINSVITLIANSEKQTGNVYKVIQQNCLGGPLAQLRGVGMDVGETRIIVPEECGGGYISAGTAGAASMDGGLQTFIPIDESHLMVGRAKDTAQTALRNATKRKLDAEPWYLETTTMYQPGMNSLAEDTYRTAWAVAEGKTKHDQRLLFDHRYAVLGVEDMSNEKKLMRALMESHGSVAKSTDGYDHLILPDGRITRVNPNTGMDDEGNSLATKGVEPGPSKYGWVDLEGPKNRILNAGTDVNQGIRYYLNFLTSSMDAWLLESQIQAHLVGKDMYLSGDRRQMMDAWKNVIHADEPITLGFDGSDSDDSTALVGCRVRDGLLFLIKLEQKPDDARAAEWRVNREAFDGMVRYMFAHYNVVAFFADVNPWESMIMSWERDFSDKLAVGTRGRNVGKIHFYTNSWSRDVYQALVNMAANFRYDMKTIPRHAEPDVSSIALLADPRLVDHFRNARRRERSFGYLVFKETPNSPKKIDAMMAGLLAYTARNRYLTDGVKEEDVTQFIPFRVY